MRSTGTVRVDGRVAADDLSLFQTLVVKASDSKTHSRIQMVAWALVTIAYSICDLADAVRQHGGSPSETSR